MPRITIELNSRDSHGDFVTAKFQIEHSGDLAPPVVKMRGPKGRMKFFARHMLGHEYYETQPVEVTSRERIK